MDFFYKKIENKGPAAARIGIKGHAPLSQFLNSSFILQLRFCLEHDISFLTRNKIMMVLNKYSMQHTMSEYLFWKEKIYSEVKDFPNLDNCEFKKMLLLFWKDYVITDE